MKNNDETDGCIEKPSFGMSKDYTMMVVEKRMMVVHERNGRVQKH